MGKCSRTSETLTVGCHKPAHTGSSTPQYTRVSVHIIHVGTYLFISLSSLSLSPPTDRVFTLTTHTPRPLAPQRGRCQVPAMVLSPLHSTHLLSLLLLLSPVPFSSNTDPLPPPAQPPLGPGEVGFLAPKLRAPSHPSSSSRLAFKSHHTHTHLPV